MKTPTPTRGRISRVEGRTVGWVVAGATVIAALAWVDVLFIPLALLGPVVVGAASAARQGSRLAVAAMWFLAGIGMLLTDWMVNSEDRMFHLVLAVIMAGLASCAHLVTTTALRRQLT